MPMLQARWWGEHDALRGAEVRACCGEGRGVRACCAVVPWGRRSVASDGFHARGGVRGCPSTRLCMGTPVHKRAQPAKTRRLAPFVYGYTRAQTGPTGQHGPLHLTCVRVHPPRNEATKT